MPRRLALALTLAALAPSASAADTTRVRMSIDEDPIVIRLAQDLGFLEDEGIEVVPVDVTEIAGEDYLIQPALVEGKIDASYHWFHHTIFGARHGFPVRAVMMFNDAPGITIMVADRVKAQVRRAADFKGRRIAEGASYATKSVLTSYLAMKAGLPPRSYTPVFAGKEGRQEAVIKGLHEGTVDVLTFQEPVTSALKATGMVSVLYDLNSGESTRKVLGAAYPAQSLLVSPRYIGEHPETVQRLVNAFVRTMRFIDSHDAEQIAAKLPAAYFRGKDRAAEVKLIRDTLPTFARGDYSFSLEDAKLVTEINLGSDFDQSEEGRWRATGDKSKVHVEDLYDNRFVDRAMTRIP